MNIEIVHRQNTFGRAIHLLRKVRLTIGGAALLGDLELVHAEIDHLGAGQLAASQESSSGVASRSIAASLLREDLRAIHSVATLLDPAQFPGIAQRFRMPRTNGYTAMLNTARSFLGEIEPDARQLFVDRLGAELFERIAGLVAEFETHTMRKDIGRIQQLTRTAALWQAARRGLRILRELDPIMSVLLRHDPALLVTWKSASHVERRRSRKTTAEERAPEISTVATPNDESIRASTRAPEIAIPENVPAESVFSSEPRRGWSRPPGPNSQRFSGVQAQAVQSIDPEVQTN